MVNKCSPWSDATLWHLIWVYTVYSSLSVTVFRVITVYIDQTIKVKICWQVDLHNTPAYLLCHSTLLWTEIYLRDIRLRWRGLKFEGTRRWVSWLGWDLIYSSIQIVCMECGVVGCGEVSCILRRWGVQLILAHSWAGLAILVAGMGRGGMYLFFLFLHFHSCSSFFPVPLFHLLRYLFYLFSLSLEMTQNDPQGLMCH